MDGEESVNYEGWNPCHRRYIIFPSVYLRAEEENALNVLRY